MSSDYDSVADQLLKPQTKVAKIKAIEIWSQFCDRTIPVRINDIIQKMGIPTKEEDNLSVDGITRMDSNGVCFILYSKNRPIVRKRFTLAHEIGHIVLEHVSIFGDCAQHSKKSQEIEANAFAGELLVPSIDLKGFITEQARTIQEITDRYWISEEVAWIAIQNGNFLDNIKANK